MLTTMKQKKILKYLTDSIVCIDETPLEKDKAIEKFKSYAICKFKTRGGKRKGAGRKSMKDKKQSVNIWLRPSEIEKNGGVKKVKAMMYDAVGCSPCI